MSGRQHRVKLHPFRILVMISYGTYGWLKSDGASVDIWPSGLCRTLKVPRDRVHSYFTWLEKFGYLENVIHERGRIRATIKTPPRFLPRPQEIS